MTATRHRSSLRRRRRGDHTVRDRLQGVTLGLLGLAILAALFTAWRWATVHNPPLDQANCPVAGPTAIQAVVIDRSDPITPLQQQQVLQYLERLLTDAKTGERFDLYTVEGDTKSAIKPIVSACSPGRGADANELYQNPQRIQQKFDEQFAQRMRRAVRDLLEPSTQTSSPILETLKAVAVNSFGPEERGRIPMRMTIVSDMVQHSASNSHFRGEANWPDLERRPEWRTLQANLTHVDVWVLYLLQPAAIRPNGQPVQNRGHQLFWEHAIRASGGQLVSLETY